MARGAPCRHEHTGHVYISDARDPTLNLAFEDALLQRHADPVCFLYRNDACVVIGRNQNLWRELDMPAMAAAGVPVVRRRSGGGTVYHDTGNLNFSFHTSKTGFARTTHTALVARALSAPPVALPARFGRPPVFLNARNDLAVLDVAATSDAAEFERKVSGSAYKLTGRRAYHHGTLLLDADLSRMSMLRRRGARRCAMHARGVESVPSPVANLCATFPAHIARLSPEHVAAAIHAEFARTYGACRVVRVDDAQLRADPDVRRSYDELCSWAWIYGAEPHFDVRVSARDGLPQAGVPADLVLHLACERGVVSAVEAYTADATVRAAAERLVGVPYDALAIAPPSAAPPSAAPPRDTCMRRWLRAALW